MRHGLGSELNHYKRWSIQKLFRRSSIGSCWVILIKSLNASPSPPFPIPQWQAKNCLHRFPKDPYAHTATLEHFGNGDVFRASRGEYEAHIINCTLSLPLSFSLCVLRRRDCGKALSPSQNIYSHISSYPEHFPPFPRWLFQNPAHFLNLLLFQEALHDLEE